jgi:hypothetical protein
VNNFTLRFLMQENLIMSRLTKLFLPLGLVALVSAGCGGGGSAETPTLSISSPPDNAVIGRRVTLTWMGGGAEIVPATGARRHEEAHYHIFIDEEPVLEEGHAIPTGVDNIIHTADSHYELSGLPPGEHTVTVVLGYRDHTPWQPEVMDSVRFTVAEPMLREETTEGEESGADHETGGEETAPAGEGEGEHEAAPAGEGESAAPAGEDTHSEETAPEEGAAPATESEEHTEAAPEH